jgi:hypothetical protein
MGYPVNRKRCMSVRLLGTITYLQTNENISFTRMTGLAAQIAAPDLRARALRRIAARWIVQDEAAAIRWMEQDSGLPLPTQQMILHRHRNQ